MVKLRSETKSRDLKRFDKLRWKRQHPDKRTITICTATKFCDNTKYRQLNGLNGSRSKVGKINTVGGALPRTLAAPPKTWNYSKNVK